MFLLYVAELFYVVAGCGFTGHSYADDTQVYSSTPAVDCSEAMDRLTTCIARIRDWMASNRLFAYLGRSPHCTDWNQNLHGGSSRRPNHVCKVSRWYFQGLRFYRGSNFPVFLLILHGPYNSAARLRCLWLIITFTLNYMHNSFNNNVSTDDSSNDDTLFFATLWTAKLAFVNTHYHAALTKPAKWVPIVEIQE